MRLFLRRALDQDFNYIAELTREEIGRYTDKPITDRLIQKKLNKNTTYIIYSRMKRIGFVSFRKERQNSLFLDLMVLEKRAQHKGIGQKILKQLSRYALKNDLEAIELQVFERNIPAIRAYIKYGFECTRKQRGEWSMKKSLTSR
ncbi:MAG: GNAT family N-acetyltransferase [Bacillaceae bacterium]|nr:GNAT family N-acetyltransferase [Bacillaceae bacterium]